MAPYAARLASARHIARRSRIKVKDFEARVGTIYTVDTVAALLGHYPRHDFIWLMGADTVTQFHQWKQWRRLAAMVPIAVLPRPGYDGPCPRGPRDGLAEGIRPSRGHRKQLDDLECTGDHLPSPAARSDLRHFAAWPRPFLVSSRPRRRHSP